MHPALIVGTQVAQGAKSALSNRKVQIVLIVLLLLLIFRSKIRRLIQDIRKRKFDKNSDKAPEQLAQLYRAMLNPSGFSWLINLDGTKTKHLAVIAERTRGQLQAVADAYSLAFDGDSLINRLRKELTTDDFNKWLNTIRK